MGGIDWAGLPFVVDLLGIADVEHLVDALLAIKLHKPEAPDGPTQEPED